MNHIEPKRGVTPTVCHWSIYRKGMGHDGTKSNFFASLGLTHIKNKSLPHPKSIKIWVSYPIYGGITCDNSPIGSPHIHRGVARPRHVQFCREVSGAVGLTGEAALVGQVQDFSEAFLGELRWTDVKRWLISQMTNMKIYGNMGMYDI